MIYMIHGPFLQFDVEHMMLLFMCDFWMLYMKVIYTSNLYFYDEYTMRYI